MKGNYLSVSDISKKWEVSPRYIQNLCKEGRIEGAVKFGNVWAIPANSKRPNDLRVKSGKYKNWRNKISEKQRRV